MVVRETGTRPTKEEAALDVAQSMPMFRTSAGTVYASLPQGDAEITSTEYRRWVKRETYSKHGQIPNNSQIGDVIDIVSGGQMPTMEVFRRVAGSIQDKIYIDDVGATRGIVEVTKEGWQYTSSCPYKFVRPVGQMPLPEPAVNGDLGAFYSLPTRCNREGMTLIAAWMLGCFCPSIPYPILVLEGPAGSGESTMSRLCKSLVDNNSVVLLTEPKDSETLALACRTSHVLVFDNLSRINGVMSNMLCSAATGGTTTKRAQYKDFEMASVELRNPIILTGLSGVLSKQDVIHRSLILKFNTPLASQTLDEATLKNAFDSVSGDVLGGILAALSEGLRNWNKTHVAELPRMADFARFVYAAAKSLGTTIEELSSLLLGMQHAQQIEATEAQLPIDVLCVSRRNRHPKSVDSTPLPRALFWGGRSVATLTDCR